MVVSTEYPQITIAPLPPANIVRATTVSLPTGRPVVVWTDVRDSFSTAPLSYQGVHVLLVNEIDPDQNRETYIPLDGKYAAVEVAARIDGGFVVGLTTSNDGYKSTKVLSFNADGTLVRQFSPWEFEKGSHSIVALRDGGHILVEATGDGTLGSTYVTTIYRFDADDTLPSARFRLTDYAFDFMRPQVIELASGLILGVWEQNGIVGKIFTQTGTPIKGFGLPADTSVSDVQLSDVVLLDSGDFLIIWNERERFGSEVHDYAMIFNQDGTVARSRFDLDFGSADAPGVFEAFALSGGGFVTPQARGSDLVLQIWDAAGNKVGSPISGVGLGDYAMLSDGRFFGLQTNASGGLQAVAVNFNEGSVTRSGTKYGDTMVGTAWSDVLSGLAGDDMIAGNADNDRLAGGSGRDSLNGGAGDDVLSGTLSDAAFDPLAAQVYRIYRATLDRDPDAAGLTAWVSQMSAGKTAGDVAGRFVASTEFQNRYGATDNAAFVTLLYQNVLDRAPDAGGLAAWTSLLNGGRSRADVVLGFANSREFTALTESEAVGFGRGGLAVGWGDEVFRIYRATLGRAPDVAGFEAWTEALGNGRQMVDVLNGFINSTEFRIRFDAEANADFVTLLYQNVLGRLPDATGLAAWTDALDSGARTRADVVRGFVQSAEFIASSTPAYEEFAGQEAFSDTLEGGGGRNILFGGLGADTFVFSALDGGTHIVADYDPEDLLRFTDRAYSPTEFRSHLVQSGEDVVFTDSGLTVILANTRIAEVNLDWITA